MMQSLVVPAVPAIQRALHVPADRASWAVTAFLLSSAVATPIAGRLGDLLGKRRVLVAILVVVALGSALCAIPSLGALVAGRVVQGASGGVLPLAYAIVRDELPPGRRPSAIALLATMLGVGGGLGVIGAGLLVEWWSYTSIFWLQVPAFAAVTWAVWRHVPAGDATRADVRIDWAGAALVSGGLVALLVTITQARAWGGSSPRTAAGAGAAALLLATWAWWALRAPAPLLDLRMMRRRPIWTTNVAAFLVGVGQFAGFVLIPQYVQDPDDGFGVGPLVSGLYLVPMTFGVLLGGLATEPFERRGGARALLLAGAGSLAASMALLAFARSTPLEVCTASLLVGTGAGATMSALATLIVTFAPSGETGAASGVNNVARTLGGALGTQIGAALLAGGAAGFTPAFAVALGTSVLALTLAPLLPRPLEESTPAAAVPGATTREPV